MDSVEPNHIAHRGAARRLRPRARLARVHDSAAVCCCACACACDSIGRARSHETHSPTHCGGGLCRRLWIEAKDLRRSMSRVDGLLAKYRVSSAARGCAAPRPWPCAESAKAARPCTALARAQPRPSLSFLARAGMRRAAMLRDGAGSAFAEWRACRAGRGGSPAPVLPERYPTRPPPPRPPAQGPSAPWLGHAVAWERALMPRARHKVR